MYAIRSYYVTATLSDAKGDKIESDDDLVTKWGVYAQESLRNNFV